MPAKKAKPDRNNRYSVEITDAAVRVIRINAGGAIASAGEAEITDKPETFGREYIDALAKAVGRAAREAKVPIGLGIPCAVVTGGPHVIIRRFTWPEMNEAAISINASQEIATYLPDDPSLFTVHYRVIRRMAKTEMTAATIDVMAAAVPTDFAAAVIAAVNKSGFSAKRLDVRENARGKFAEVFRHNIKISLPDETAPDEPFPIEDTPIEEIVAEKASAPPASYVILDVTNPQINISMYLDGIFYSNRYFATTDPDLLANEISSIIDYIHYRERASVVQCVMMLGEEETLPGIIRSLQDNLDIPVFTTKDWLDEKAVGKKLSEKGADIARFMDAYGAALPANRDINTAPPKQVSKSAKIAIPIAITSVLLGAAVFLAIFIPNGLLTLKLMELSNLEKQLSEVPISAEEIAQLTTDIEGAEKLIKAEKKKITEAEAKRFTLDDRVSDVEAFTVPYQQASSVIPLIRDVETRYPGQTFQSVSVSSGGMVTIDGTASDMKQVASDIRAFAESGRFDNIYVAALTSSDGGEDYTDMFENMNANYGSNPYGNPSGYVTNYGDSDEEPVSFNLQMSVIPGGE